MQIIVNQTERRSSPTRRAVTNMKTIVIIPAYEPEEKLIPLTQQLIAKDLEVVVVDDGSGEKYLPIFNQLTGATVLTHPENKGKGEGLKTAYRYIKETYADEEVAIVTADSDGQHSPEDIMRIATRASLEKDSLVLGVRNFDGTHVPLKSRVGNKITLKIFELTSGTKISDTQTGLRGFSSTHLEKMLEISGSRFEYEMNVLMVWAKEKRPFCELEIQTIYENKNEGSHFNPLRDSFRIYKEIFQFALSSILSFFLDYTLYAFQIFIGVPLVTANVVARVISAGFNFFVNKKFVFASDKPVLKELGGYILLASFSLTLNTLILMGLSASDHSLVKSSPKSGCSSLTGLYRRKSFLDKRKVCIMSNNKKGKSLRKILTTAYTAVLIGASGFVIADTLFISKSLAKFSNETAAATNTATGTSASGTGTSGNSSSSSTSTTPTVSTATAYEDDTKSITIETYERNNTQIHVATVKIKGNASIKTALANETYGRNVTAKTSTTAKSVNAVLAINGDYYGARDAGYVVRNGQLLRSESQSADQEDLVIYKDGSFGIIKEGDITAQQLVDNGAMQVLSFGPALIENGQVAVDSSDEVGKAMASNPRTAIGIVDDSTYVFVVSDGRTSESQGLSLKQLAEFMKELNVTTAYNLDGGGSSTMYFNGQIINKPTTNGRNIEEREVSDIVYL